MSVENLNLMNSYEKSNGNLTHLGQNLNKLQKSKQVLEKNLGNLTLQMNENTKQITNLKIENSKLRKDLEKVKTQKSSMAGVLGKLNDELRQRDELIKKHANYINKLENQLLKGNFSSDLIHTNRKLEDKICILERENKEYEALNQALKVKLANHEEEITMLTSCLKININEFLKEESSQNRNHSVEEIQNLMLSRQKGADSQKMQNELEHFKILIANHQLELASYQEAMRQSFIENQNLKTKIEELSNNNQNVQTQLLEKQNENLKFSEENANLKQEIRQIQDNFNEILLEKSKLQKENQKFHENISEYKELFGICQDFFSGDFEGVLKESLSIIYEKKAMKQKIHDIVSDCTTKLLGDEF